jgi:hypothetical protein
MFLRALSPRIAASSTRTCSSVSTPFGDHLEVETLGDADNRTQPRGFVQAD